MTYGAIELSPADAAPVELYDFSYTGRAWRYTSGDEEVEFGSVTYIPVSLTRSSLKPAINKEKAGLTLSLPLNCGLAEVFRVAPPSEEVALTVYRYHRNDGNGIVAWSGRVLNARFTEYELELTLESIMSAVQRTILTRKYQKGCPYLLYKSGCNVDPLSHQVTTTVSTISGSTVICPITPTSDFYAGGILSYMSTVTGIKELRFIVSNSGGAILLDRYPYGLLEGMRVDLLPGCRHTVDDCKNKFNNIENYGGQPNIPTKNPFGGTAIF